jgi:hypothetical protein
MPRHSQSYSGKCRPTLPISTDVLIVGRPARHEYLEFRTASRWPNLLTKTLRDGDVARLDIWAAERHRVATIRLWRER